MNVRHAAIDLPPVSVALHRQIDQAEALLRRILDFLRQQNRAGAGPENRFFARKLP